MGPSKRLKAFQQEKSDLVARVESLTALQVRLSMMDPGPAVIRIHSSD